MTTTTIRSPILVEAGLEEFPEEVPVVIGMDTDSNGYHYISNIPIWDGSGDQDEPDRFGWIGTSGDIEARRAIQFYSAKRMFMDLPTDRDVHVFCEESLSLQNGATNRKLAMATGAIWAAWIQAGGLKKGREWAWVDVAHWKKVVIGRGIPPKEFAWTPKSERTKAWIRDFCLNNAKFQQEWLTQRDTEPWMFANNWNLYDAWCLKEYGVQELNKWG